MIRLINDDVMFVDESRSVLHRTGCTIVEHLRGKVYTREEINNLFEMVPELIRLRKNLSERSEHGREARGVIMTKLFKPTFMEDNESISMNDTLDYQYVTVRDIDEMLKAIPVLARCL
jgi:hypothetical protein